MPSNRRRSISVLSVTCLLLVLVAPTIHAAGHQESRGWLALVWSWFGPDAPEAAVVGYSGFAEPDSSMTDSATLAFSGAGDPNGRAATPAPPPAPASAVGDADDQ